MPTPPGFVVKRAEHPVHVARLEADAGVVHGDPDHIVVVTLGPDDELSWPARHRRHRLDGVHHEVEHHLLQLDPISASNRFTDTPWRCATSRLKCSTSSAMPSLCSRRAGMRSVVTDIR